MCTVTPTPALISIPVDRRPTISGYRRTTHDHPLFYSILHLVSTVDILHHNAIPDRSDFKWESTGAGPLVFEVYSWLFSTQPGASLFHRHGMVAIMVHDKASMNIFVLLVFVWRTYVLRTHFLGLSSSPAIEVKQCLVCCPGSSHLY